MRHYDERAPKRAVNMTLNEDLVRMARELTPNLSEQVEKLLAAYVVSERERQLARDHGLDAAIDAFNEFDKKYGSFADENLDYL